MCWPAASMNSVGFSYTNENENRNFHAKDIPNENGYLQLNRGSVRISAYNWYFLELIKAFDAGFTSVTFMLSI